MNQLQYPDAESEKRIVKATERLKLQACSMVHRLQQNINKKMQLLSSGFLSASDFQVFLDQEYHTLQIEKQKAILSFENEIEVLHQFLNSPQQEARRINAALAAYCVYFDNDLIGEATHASKQWWMYMQGEFRYPELFVYLEEAFLPIRKRCDEWVFGSK